MSYNKNSKKRLCLLLANFAVIVYTLLEGRQDAKILAFLVLTLWLWSAKTWIEKETK